MGLSAWGSFFADGGATRACDPPVGPTSERRIALAIPSCVNGHGGDVFPGPGRSHSRWHLCWIGRSGGTRFWAAMSAHCQGMLFDLLGGRVGLIRFRGRFRKGDYDVHDGEDDKAPAGAPAVR